MGIGLKTSTIFAGAVLAFGLASPSFAATRQMEKLSRGLAVANTGKGMLVSWRLLGTENPDTEFNLYRAPASPMMMAGHHAEIAPRGWANSARSGKKAKMSMESMRPP